MRLEAGKEKLITEREWLVTEMERRAKKQEKARERKILVSLAHVRCIMFYRLTGVFNLTLCLLCTIHLFERHLYCYT